MKPRVTIDSQMNDIAPFQKENNDSPPTLSHLDMDEETSINNELVDYLVESSEFRVGEDEHGKQEDEEGESNINEQELDELLANEDED